MKAGEDNGWETLGRLDPRDVARRSGATYDQTTNSYRLPFYGESLLVSPGGRAMTGGSAEADVLLGRFGYFSKLSILTYLATAKPIPPTGRLVKPVDMRSGDIYFRGSHVLPLGGIASAYGRDAPGFLAQGRRFGGDATGHGDVSLRFLPFHNFPLELILWLSDDEFPARADLLFDAAGEELVPADIVWSIAMLTTLLMMP